MVGDHRVCGFGAVAVQDNSADGPYAADLVDERLLVWVDLSHDSPGLIDLVGKVRPLGCRISICQGRVE